MVAKKTTKKETKVEFVKRSFNDRHPFVVPVITIFVLFIGSVFGFFMFGGQVVQPGDTKIVRFHSEGKNQSIVTRAKTVNEFLERSNINVEPGDVVEPSQDSEITSEEFSVNLYKAKPVTLVDEKGEKTITKSAETIPEVVAKKAGYNLYPEDIVEVVEPDKSLEQGIIGTHININRATPIKLNLFGATYDIRTHAETVADLAKERGIDFNDSTVLPAPQSKLKDNELVFITQPGKQLVTADEIIPFAEETVFDTGLAIGSREVRTPGQAGRRVAVYEVLPGGSKKILQEIIVSNPVKQVVVKGKKVTAPNVSVAADKVTLMSQAGISADQHGAADFIISHESGWRPAARSANNCIGLGQRCNPTILINACPNWETDAVCQLQHFNGYAVGRYGSWNEAYAFWTVNRWW
jgi:resuscitation-promoting factor RpfB